MDTTMVYGRELSVGDTVIFGECPDNLWTISELRDAAPNGTPYGNFRGYTAVYAGSRFRFPEPQNGSLKGSSLVRKVLV